jgi:1-acyl-sn-glycerol-3-phosphate acyltransferase
MVSPLEALTNINLEDLVNAFGCQGHSFMEHLVRRLFFRPAQTFAQQMLNFDSSISINGIADAACLAERSYVRAVSVFGADRLPTGPFLALSNHPGVTDTLAVIAALGRADLKVIALNRPFLLSLPNLSKQLFFVTDDPNERVALVRRVSMHLRNGGSVLTFPAGHNEPDPDIYPGAVESLSSWLESAGVFIRLAPETAVVPVCVRGVTWNRTAHHPLTHLRRTFDDQQLLASAMQLLSHVMLNTRPVTVRVQIGRPITVSELGSTDTRVIHQALLSEMKDLIENPPVGTGQDIL